MNNLRSAFIRGWNSSIMRFAKKPNLGSHKNNQIHVDDNIQTAPDRISGAYIQQVRQMTKQEIKKPWYKYYGILFLLSILPTYYLTYKVLQEDENTPKQQQNIKKAINAYYFRSVMFTSILAMIAALRFRNPNLVFIEQTNMSAIPFILPLLTCAIGLSLPPTWSNPLLLAPAFATQGLLTFLMLTRRSTPIPLLYFKTYCLYYDIIVLIILGFYLRSYHKDAKKLKPYIEQ